MMWFFVGLIVGTIGGIIIAGLLAAASRDER